MSRQKLSEVLTRRKQLNKTSGASVAIATPKSVRADANRLELEKELLGESSSDRRSAQSVSVKAPPAKRSSKYEEETEEEDMSNNELEYSEEEDAINLDEPVAKPVVVPEPAPIVKTPKPKGRPSKHLQKEEPVISKEMPVVSIKEPAVQKQEEPQETGLPDAVISRLIKKAEIGGTASEVVGAVRECMEAIVSEVVPDGTALTHSHIQRMVEHHFKNEEDLPEDVTIPATVFVNFARPLFLAKNSSWRRDAVMLLHLYAEAYVIKMLKCADMIAATSKRSRVTDLDLQVAYEIYNA